MERLPHFALAGGYLARAAQLHLSALGVLIFFSSRRRHTMCKSDWSSDVCSSDLEWGAKPLVSFPQKFYCGTYQIVLELGDHPAVRFLRAKWLVNRWGKGEPKPLFTLYLVAEAHKRELALQA